MGKQGGWDADARQTPRPCSCMRCPLLESRVCGRYTATTPATVRGVKNDLHSMVRSDLHAPSSLSLCSLPRGDTSPSSPSVRVVDQDRSFHGLAQKFENQMFTAAMNVEDYNNRINKKLSKVQKVRVRHSFFSFLCFVQVPTDRSCMTDVLLAPTAGRWRSTMLHAICPAQTLLPLLLTTISPPFRASPPRSRYVSPLSLVIDIRSGCYLKTFFSF